MAILAWRRRDRRRIVGNAWVDERPDGVTLEELLGYKQRRQEANTKSDDHCDGDGLA